MAIEDWGHKRTFTAEEIREAVRYIINNLDWDIVTEAEIDRLIKASDMAELILEQQDDGKTFELDQAYNNFWDWLWEYSLQSAARQE